MHELPIDEREIDVFVAAFEDGTLPKARWTHAAHIFTGACYVDALGEEAAIARMRERVSAFNVAVGGQNTATSGYHETVTVFWIKLIALVVAKLRAADPTLSRSALLHNATASLADRRGIYWEYYDFDLLRSEEARRMWIAPTLRPL